MCQFSSKTDKSDFFCPNLPKNGFLVRNSENKYWNKNHHPRYTMYANFQTKQTTLTFLTQICPKKNLEFEIHKTNVGIRISILEIPCVPIFKQNKRLWLFWPKYAQQWIFGWKFIKLMSESESASLRYHVWQFSSKTKKFDFLNPNLPKSGFWSRNFKNLSLDSESAPPR